jgi:hypothetical protein
MDLERAARESGVVRPEHLAALLRSLKSPDFRWIVSSPSQTDERLQGDLVSQMPIALIDAAGRVRSRDLIAMVLNNACDLQYWRSKFITLAPVTDFEIFASRALKKDPERARSYLESVRANRIDEIFYIPNCPQLTNGGIVRFDLMSSLSAVVYETAIAGKRRFASLTQSGFYFLLMKLTHFLARPESSEIIREKET